MRGPRAREQGFTLVELLVVVGMLSLVMASIYSVFISHQKTAYSQGEVVEVQQNLRVALDNLARDLRMAGAMLPAGTLAPIASATGSPAFPNYSSAIMTNTASAEGRFARIEMSPDTLTAGVQASISLDVEAPATAASPNIVDGFAVGDQVRIVRPVDGSQPVLGTKTLVVTDTAGNPSRGDFSATPRTPPAITLSKSDSSNFGGEVIMSGDMIVKVAADGASPMTVAYYLVNAGVAVNGFACPTSQKCLVRQVNGLAAQSEIVATNVTSLRFKYLDDSYNEAAVPSDLSKIRAVRITLQGATAKTEALSGGAKVREITTVVKLRNRR